MSTKSEEVFRGATVLITGASSGIGSAFAHRAAQAGGDVILVARRIERLEQTADALRSTHGVTVRVCAADLSLPGAAARLDQTLRDRDVTVDVVINNAGIGIHGDLALSRLDSVSEQIQINVTAVAELTTLLLPGMISRDRGTVINVASTAAFQPVAHMAVYAATKSFVLSFTEALWAETRHSGVAVLAVCPGATDTEFFETAGADASVGRRRDPEDVVTTTLRALERRRPSVVDGCGNAALANLAAHLPRRMAIAAAERSVRPAVGATV